MSDQFTTLFESSISRVVQAADRFDIATITGWRHEMVKCVKKDHCTGKILTRKDKDDRNVKLKAALLHRGYGVTHIDGNFIEQYGTTNAKECAEQSFLVVNLDEDYSFTGVIARLGAEFCQACVFVKPRGQTPYLIGTNNEDWPGLWKKVHLANMKVGWKDLPIPKTKDHPKIPGNPRASHMGYSKIGGRPIGWTEGYEAKFKLDNNAKSIVSLWGSKVLESAGAINLPFAGK